MSAASGIDHDGAVGLPHNPGADKWDKYYSTGPPGSAPFDSAQPSSQLVDFLTTCMQSKVCDKRLPGNSAQLQAVAVDAPLYLPSPATKGVQPHTCQACSSWKPATGGQVLEVGCGTGASARWLAHRGYQVKAIDISSVALQAAAAAAAAEDLPENNPQWLQQDIFQLKDCEECAYDFIYDCQVYHVLVKDTSHGKDQLPLLLLQLLKPGGILMILAGNANEPQVGPNTLTAKELLQPLLDVGFELIQLLQTRFDNTHYYDEVLRMRPLAWWTVLQKPGAMPR